MSTLEMDRPDTAYWEDRAQRFAARGRGLAAVCSYGMPAFYNAAIDLCQRRALAPWLDVSEGMRVLDLGCGVGRWSLALAGRGAHVTGLDLSETMVRTAARSAAARGLDHACTFRTADVSRLALDETFDLVLAVTVLQHVPSAAGVERALAGVRRSLAPGGRVVLLEAAPGVDGRKTEHERLRIRSPGFYTAAAQRAGLDMVAMTGVDLFPLKKLYLPLYGRLPRPLAVAGLGLVTASLFPVEYLLGRRWRAASWHKVMVFQSAGGAA